MTHCDDPRWCVECLQAAGKAQGDTILRLRARVAELEALLRRAELNLFDDIPVHSILRAKIAAALRGWKGGE